MATHWFVLRRTLARLQWRRLWPHEADLVRVEAEVGELLARLGPVQLIQARLVLQDLRPLLEARAAGDVGERQEASERVSKARHPTAQVQVALFGRRVRSTWVVVHSRGEGERVQLPRVVLLAAAPPIRGGQRTRLRAVEPVEPHLRRWAADQLQASEVQSMASTGIIIN